MPADARRCTDDCLRRRICAWALVLATACLGAFAAPASMARAAVAGTTLERSVKAAFLYKFLGYAEFPASAFHDAAAPLVMGVAGAEDMAVELSRTVAGRNVNSRPIVVRYLRESEPAAGVHLLFVTGADRARAARLFKSLQPAPVLLVTEAEGGLQAGSVINFTIIDERVRFDVSLEAAEKNQVKLSSRLLGVANHVQKGAP